MSAGNTLIFQRPRFLHIYVRCTAGPLSAEDGVEHSRKCRSWEYRGRVAPLPSTSLPILRGRLADALRLRPL